jgi:hypothetical protein
MKTWVRKTLSVGVLAAGALLFAPAAAHADVSQDSSDNNGILNGTQLVAPVSVPLNIVGNAIGVAGEANAAGAGWNQWTEGGKVSQDSSDNNGILNGTQAYLPISVPVNVVGNAVGVLGEANAAGTGWNGRKKESARTESGKGVDQDSSDNNGVLNGTQIYAPIDIPINICGNALSLLGEANAGALCGNGKHRTEGGWVSQDSSDNNGIANGTQLYAPISLPVNLAGNSVAVLGEANAAATASNESGHENVVDQDSSDNNGLLNGTQIAAPIDVPINVCGNALGILGEANASAACSNGGHGHGHGHDDGDDNGNDDGDYDDDNGNDDGDYDDDAGADNYGNDNDGRKPHQAHQAHGKAATEQSPVAGVTDSLSGVGSLGLGGVNLLNGLR